MKITYIAHSGFMVELERTVLLFDYYKGTIPPIPEEKMLYVFVSHRHEDHFNPEIFRIRHPLEHLCYILAYDIKLNERNCSRWGITESIRSRIYSLQADEKRYLPDEMQPDEMQPNGILTETLKSTDEGVAFLVTAEGHTIFHAGDLNWWLWREESSSWNNSMTASFWREVEKISGRELDAAFLPLDDRQEEDFYKGMDWYLRNCSVKYAFPMHFWEDDSVIERFEQLECRKDYATIICDTAKKNIWEIMDE
ncbi:MAG: MBL fold metallo-hydrolase [Lachnospiraceae bacterium]|nr:MBL fold metallo-hydrolase [Lachnospiraceae bacterium]